MGCKNPLLQSHVNWHYLCNLIWQGVSVGSTGSSRHSSCFDISAPTTRSSGQELNAHNSALAEALSTHAAWSAFHQNLCAPPATPIQPTCPVRTQPARPVDALEASITQAEVEKALPRCQTARLQGRQGGLLSSEARSLPHYLGLWPLGQDMDACSHPRQLPQCMLHSHSAWG